MRLPRGEGGVWTWLIVSVQSAAKIDFNELVGYLQIEHFKKALCHQGCFKLAGLLFPVSRPKFSPDRPRI